MTQAVMSFQTALGVLRAPADGGEVVAGRYVRTPIDFDLPGADNQPALHLRIEVVDGVPLCTQVTIKRSSGGREVRPKDLRALVELGLDPLVDYAVGHMSAQLVNSDDTELEAVFDFQPASVDAGVKAIRRARKGSGRKVTRAHLERVAEVYNRMDEGGIEALTDKFGFSRSTAQRRIAAAREAGLIEARKR